MSSEKLPVARDEEEGGSMYKAPSAVSSSAVERGLTHRISLDRGLQRTITLAPIPEKPTGISLPPRSQTRTRIPIHYRTLSIHVYDSQRFDHSRPEPKKQPLLKSVRLPWQKKTVEQTGPSEDDAAFFGKLDFHSITPHLACQRFNVAPDVGLDSAAVTKRLARNGPNKLAGRQNHYLRKIIRYVFGGFNVILWIAVIVFMISWRPLGNPPAPYNLALAIVILIVITFSAVFAAAQEWSAQRVSEWCTASAASSKS